MAESFQSLQRLLIEEDQDDIARRFLSGVQKFQSEGAMEKDMTGDFQIYPTKQAR